MPSPLSPRQSVLLGLAKYFDGLGLSPSDVSDKMEVCAKWGRDSYLNFGGIPPSLIGSETSGQADSPHIVAAPTPIPPPPMNNPDAKWLSANEEALLRAATDDWQTQDDLITRAGLEPSRDLAAVLRNLVARSILDSAPSRGFRRHQPMGDN